jgi:DNA-binding CsgD family transcriptional regulator
MTDTTMLDVSRAVAGSPLPAGEPHYSELLLIGMSSLMTEGRAAAAPTLRRAVRGFLAEHAVTDKGMRWTVIASVASVEVWDFDSWDDITVRQMQLARETGALGLLAISLSGMGLVHSWSGNLDAADRVGAESVVISEATGTQIAPFGGMLLAAIRGRDSESFAVLESAGIRAAADGDGFALQFKHWTTAILCNGLCRYEEALDAAQRTWDAWPDLFVGVWAMVEFVEAAVRLDRPHMAAEPLERIVASAEVSGTDWGLGVAARSRAMLGEGNEAETLYQQAIKHLGATSLRPELARGHLVYGEWLRRQGRRVDARAQLRLAYSIFSTMGAEAFSERARLELVAAGAKADQQELSQDQLTAQEAHIARLAADGRTNAQIGAELYLSRHTIEWHLRKVFQKLGIGSRWELRDVLGGSEERDPGAATF